MSPRFLMVAAAMALLALTGCASTGANNTSYAQYQGYTPTPDFGASEPGGVRVGY